MYIIPPPSHTHTPLIGVQDVQPLRELSNEDFKQLCHMISMSSQPLHVLRFKEILGRPLVSHQRTSPVETSADMGPYKALSTPNKASSRKRSSQPHSPNKTPSQGSATDKKFFLPAYLQPGSECKSFDQLIDDHTPIQKELGPPPFTPATWDSKRSELIRKHSAIYGQHVSKRKTGELSPHEENVNEAACQLCLRDPTLLTRRDELFVLARRAVKEGGYSFTHGHSKSKSSETPSPKVSASKRKKNFNEEEEASNETEGPQPKRLYDGQHDELESLLSLDKPEQVTNSQAQQSNDFAAAYRLQLDITSPGNPQEDLQSERSNLKRSHHRSNSSKERRKHNKESSMNNELPQATLTASGGVVQPSTAVFIPHVSSQTTNTQGNLTTAEAGGRPWNISEGTRQFERRNVPIYPIHFPGQASAQPSLISYSRPQVFDGRSQAPVQFHTHGYSVAGQTTPNTFQQ